MTEQWEYGTAILEKENGELWDFYPVSRDDNEPVEDAAAREAREWNEEEGDDDSRVCIVVRRTPAVEAGEWERVEARESDGS
jgi:hypothetical protein